MVPLISHDIYPAEYLSGCDTALVGFCAAFLGLQDCVHIAEAGITAVCVDTDFDRLARMGKLYPYTWTFITDDIFKRAEDLHRKGVTFDLVSLDPFTNLFERVADQLDLWCSLAREVVIIGTNLETVVDPPAGWGETTRIARSARYSGVQWAVLEPC